MAPILHPGKLYKDLQDAYLRYYDTAFGVRDEGIQKERRQLLNGDGLLFTEPLLEPVPGYDDYSSIAKLGSQIGLTDLQTDLLARSVFDKSADFKLRKHQQDSLLTSYLGEDKRNVIVTAGTGSGKTEAFLLPVFARLIKEAGSWPSPSGPPAERWWSDEYNPRPWAPSRSHEPRPSAVRAIMLYPTNALVQDQVTRLRRAIATVGESGTLNGNRIYLGQYTGTTLGSKSRPLGGSQDEVSRRRRVASELRAIEKEIAGLLEAISTGSVEPSVEWDFPNPASPEMLTRWDMQSHPPDILITNAVMLNVMLMRELEDPIFESTRQWLESDRENVLTLVVDELHANRGTQGVEMGLTLRKLYRRLGLPNDSRQLRCIGTSASLEATASEIADFSQSFFGVPKETFDVIEGIQIAPRQVNALPAQRYSELGRSLAEDTSGQAVSELLDQSELDQLLYALEWACRDLDTDSPRFGKTRATALSTIVTRLFDNPFPDEVSREAAVNAVLSAVASQPADKVGTRFRAHMFVRNVRGMWACSSPKCPEVDPEFQAPDRRIGKLYPVPRITCGCGSRVLELLYCQPCGEAYLGGYTPQLNTNAEGYLFPSDTETPSGQSILVNQRTNDHFVWYWPHPIPAGFIEKWTLATSRDLPPGLGKQRGTFRLTPAYLDHNTGHIRPSHAQVTGTMMVVSGLPQSARIRVPSLPKLCPKCGRNYSNLDPHAFYSGTVRSPIRGMRTGFPRVSQVLVDQLLRQLRNAGKLQKTLVFTDSRDDAAQTSAGIALNHHRNTVRQAVDQIVKTHRPVGELMRAAAGHQVLTPGEQDIVNAHKTLDPDAWAAYTMLEKMDDQDSKEIVDKFEAQVDGPEGRFPWKNLTQQTSLALQHNGMNSAGPGASFRKFFMGDKSEREWWEAYEWQDRPVSNDIPTDLVARIRDEHSRVLRKDIADSVFGATGRDFESLGLGWVVPEKKLDYSLVPSAVRNSADEFAASLLRILGLLHRYGFQLWGDAFPQGASSYIKKVADVYGVDSKDLKDSMTRVLKATGAMDDRFTLRLENLAIIRASEDPKRFWVCKSCTRRHLHRSAGICTSKDCSSASLSETASFDDTDAGYFEWLSLEKIIPVRTAELTGQTKPLKEQRRRQRLFKGVFLPNEVQVAQDIDLLSVTTTMEVGVDIGDLESIVMANMPPERFNYQQRVGRAGRRDQPLSYALTLVRDRSHDDDYFLDPKRITGDPPPRPNIDTTRVTILRRAVASEVLRVAFLSMGQNRPAPEGDTHGSFGKTEEWQPKYRQDISRWIAENQAIITEIVGAITTLSGAVNTDVKELDVWIRNDLLGVIDKSIRQGIYAHDQLSELLANAGILPMFGFPTRQRSLFHKKPIYNESPEDSKEDDLETSSVSDRPIDYAVSAFAPGAEMVKDGAVYTSVGFASWEPGPGNRPVSREPLSQPLTVAKCSNCSAVRTVTGQDTSAETCRACGKTANVTTMYQPIGFRTDYTPGVDYDDELEGGHQGPPPMIGTAPGTGTHSNIGRIVLRPKEQEDVFVINDNNGHGFDMEQLNDKSIVVPNPDLYKLVPQLTTGNPVHCGAAIGAVSKTDVLIIELDLSDLLDTLCPLGAIPLDERYMPSGRAALTSFAHHLRVVAAHKLDISPQELKIGVQPVPLAQSPTYTGRIFLADSLENGAGYAPQIGEPTFFRELLEELKQNGTNRFEANWHMSVCDSSCLDCLRSYDNRQVHALLDWRLALDIGELAEGRTLDLSRWLNRTKMLASPVLETFKDEGAILESFGEIQGIVVPATGKIALLGHPLWATDETQNYWNDSQSEAFIHGMQRAGGLTTNSPSNAVKMSDLWTLARNPQHIIEHLN